MAGLLGWIRRHDLVAFPLLTFALGWAFYLPAMLVIAGRPERFGWLIFFQTPGAAAALLAGVLVRWARGGAPEVRAAWRRYLDWRGHPWWWWLGAVLLVPALAGVAALLSGGPGAGLADLWANLGWGVVVALPLVALAQLASSPLLEEYGWRGFWQPRLQHHLPALPAALLVGVLWGLHHVPVALAVGLDPARAVVGAVGPSVLAAWLLNTGRGSMVGPMLLHTGLNLGMAVVAPDTWWFPVVTLGAALLVALGSGWRHLGGPGVSEGPVAAGAGDDAQHPERGGEGAGGQ